MIKVKKEDIKWQDILYYFVLIMFLHPRGFSEYFPIYKSFFAAGVWIAVLLIWGQFFYEMWKLHWREKPKNWKNNLKNSIIFNKKYNIIAIYFILIAVITWFVYGNFSSGRQQLVAYPSLCLFIIMNFKKNPKKFLNIMINIFFVLFSFNILLTWIYFGDKYHITFLGHVQMISQLGIVAIFVSSLYCMLTKRNRRKAMILMFIVIFNMLITDASSAVLSAVLFIAVGVVYKYKPEYCQRLLCFKSKVYVIGMLIINIFLIGIISSDILMKVIPGLTFSGRNIIWQESLGYISKKPLLGYGVDGILIKPFWTEWTGGGFNYAHNQIIQNLLDGGIILFIAFVFMLLIFVSGIDKIKTKKYKILANTTVVLLMFIMFFDSTTIYCYMYIILALMLELPQVIQQKKKNSKRGKKIGNIS